MQIRRLGRTGLKVSEVCLGTMTFGHQCDEKVSFAILDKAAEHGVTFLDTADVYPVPPTMPTLIISVPSSIKRAVAEARRNFNSPQKSLRPHWVWGLTLRVRP